MRTRNRLPVLMAAGALAATAAVPAGAVTRSNVPSAAAVTSAASNILNDVDALSSGYAWAVGATSSGNTSKALVMRWNGIGWSAIPAPAPGVGSWLNAVVAISPTNAWAVGGYSTTRASYDGQRTLTMHWNGTAWRIVPSPSVVGTSVYKDNNLTDVAYRPGSLWAVGRGDTWSLAMRWNGVAWKITPVPHVGPGMEGLDGVTVVSTTEAWAVGQRRAMGLNRTLTMRWNGTAWKLVPSPNAGTGNNYLTGGVAATSARDIWATGSYASRTDAAKPRTLALHWDGTVWKIVPTPNPGTTWNNLDGGVSATAGNSAWAVGAASNGSGSRPLVLRWNGRTWQVSPAPIPGACSSLNGVDAVSGTLVMAVGATTSCSFARTLRLVWNGTGWRAV